jgi:hypothetical protein
VPPPSDGLQAHTTLIESENLNRQVIGERNGRQQPLLDRRSKFSCGILVFLYRSAGRLWVARQSGGGRIFVASWV